MTKTQGNKKFNETIAPMWASKNGNFLSIEIGDEQFDQLQKVEKGCKLVVKLLPDERRKSDMSPHAYLEIISKEEVKAFKEKSLGGRSQAPASPQDSGDDSL